MPFKGELWEGTAQELVRSDHLWQRVGGRSPLFDLQGDQERDAGDDPWGCCQHQSHLRRRQVQGLHGQIFPQEPHHGGLRDRTSATPGLVLSIKNSWQHCTISTSFFSSLATPPLWRTPSWTAAWSTTRARWCTTSTSRSCPTTLLPYPSSLKVKSKKYQNTIGWELHKRFFHLRDRDGSWEDHCLWLCWRRCGPVLPGVQPCISCLLCHEGLNCCHMIIEIMFFLSSGGSLLWTELKNDRYGQLFKERRRDDRQAENHLQQDQAGRHHWRADRDHFWSCRPLSLPPSSRLECGCFYVSVDGELKKDNWCFDTFYWKDLLKMCAWYKHYKSRVEPVKN